MKYVSMWLGIAVVCFGLSGCLSKHVIRDRGAWETEAAFVNNLVTAEQRAVESLMGRACVCEDDATGNKFWATQDTAGLLIADPTCADAEETLLVVRARWAWHYQMMLFNAGVSEERPGDVPAIPAALTLCDELGVSNGQ
jgi:hypothetical protein